MVSKGTKKTTKNKSESVNIMKLPKREQFSNKSTFGRVLNIAGSEYYTGAAYLSSLSALKVGCGYVALSSSPKVLNTISLRTSDVVFIPIEDVKKKLNDFDVISVGCGLSTDLSVSILFKSLLESLSNIEKPVIIDADGLNLLSKMKEDVKLPSNLILTPHPKEASRLLNVDLEKILDKPVKYAQEITKKYSCTTVLKLHSTVVCSVNEEIYINDTGNSSLSKAGSGDVLTGIIAGLCAQKMSSFEAAKLAVYLHGKTGEIASEMLSEYSVLASDLLRYIPIAISDLIRRDILD